VKTGKFSFKRKVLFRFFLGGKQIASTTPQVWLVAGSHLGFAENLFKLRHDKKREQVVRK